MGGGKTIGGKGKVNTRGKKTWLPRMHSQARHQKKIFGVSRKVEKERRAYRKKKSVTLYILLIEQE